MDFQILTPQSNTAALPHQDILPKFEYESEPASSQCSICQETLNLPRLDGTVEKAYILPCSHIFGHHCITRWLEASPHHNCPTCRRSMIYKSCGHQIRPRDATGAPDCVTEDAMPEKCTLCRQGVVWERRLVWLRERQLAEERVLEGLKMFMPTVCGSMYIASSIGSAAARLDESRERFKRDIELLRAEIEKGGYRSW